MTSYEVYLIHTTVWQLAVSPYSGGRIL